MASEYTFACAVRADGEGECWGTCTALECEPLLGPFQGVVAWSTCVCWHQVDGKVRCRASADIGFSNPPSEVSFLQVSVGHGFACGVRTDGRIQCWGEAGDNHYAQATPP